MIPFRPRGAVYISTASPDVLRAAELVAATLSAEGVAVFLDEIHLFGDDPEGQVPRAVNMADHVLVQLTPTPGTSMLPTNSGLLDRRYIWLAIGAAAARRVRVVVLLDQFDDLARQNLAADRSLPAVITRGDPPPYDSRRLQHYVTECAAPVRERTPPPTGAGVTVRLWHATRDWPAVEPVALQLEETGLTVHPLAWGTRLPDQDLGHAIAVVFGKLGFPGWTHPDFVALLRQYAHRHRPIILVGLPGYVGTSDLPGSISPDGVWWIDHRGNPLLAGRRRRPAFPVLPFLWAVGGYRMDHGFQPIGTRDWTVLRLAQDRSAGAPSPRARGGADVREPIEAALAERELGSDQVVTLWTDEGAILLLDAPAHAHAVAAALGTGGRDGSAPRFRMGAATGRVELSRRHGSDLGVNGPAVSRAILLASASAPSSVLVDMATHQALPDAVRPAYRAAPPVPHPRADVIPARACSFATPGPTAAPPQDRRKAVTQMDRLYSEAELDIVMFLLEMPVGDQPSRNLPHNDRKAAVLLWAGSGAGPGVDVLAEVLRFCEERPR